MLFNSYEFIFLFLPTSLLIFYRISKFGKKNFQVFWLVVASLIFYGWWNPPYLILLLLSMAVNYSLSIALNACHFSNQEKQGNLLLTLGVLLNLGLIGYYKYFNFFIDNLNSAIGLSLNVQYILLPLGISFYTFQQISYLVDSRDGETKGDSFLQYCLFVSFFPQLIAGPIVTHSEMIPQFSKPKLFRFNSEDFTVGLTIFSMGLFKKVIFADQIALYSTPIFEAAAQGVSITFWEGWVGALAYSLQIYFDFSGYSDMAIGLGRMFGFKLPLNFNSPYKATNIIDFWTRWHLTLTRFLTRYLYNPISLALSRRRIQQGKSLIKKGVGSFGAFLELVAVPTIITMFLAGLWHGAGWQYIIFGLLNGLYLTVNHGWHLIRKRMGHNLKSSHWLEQRLGQGLTLMGWIIALVFFRAPDVGTAIQVFEGMFGINGVSVANGAIFANQLLTNPKTGIAMIVFLYAIALFFPNTQQWLANYQPALGYRPIPNQQPKWLVKIWDRWQWQPNLYWAAITSAIAVGSILGLSQVSEFIYFQF